jgi:hypothetical protein
MRRTLGVRAGRSFPERRLSALALGNGDRPGLRVEDGSVAPATEFVVFVSESAVLE